MMKWRFSTALAVLTVALLTFGCERVDGPVAPAVVESGSPTSSLLGGVLETESTLDLVETTSSLLLEQVVTALIGSEGGTLELLGHKLTVPSGAVTEPTYFVMIVLPGNNVQVELYAIDPDTGLNVGEKGFEEPVQLALSYADVKGVKDPSKLVIVHIGSDGSREALPTTIDETAKTASADLEHFSRYALCRN